MFVPAEQIGGHHLVPRKDIPGVEHFAAVGCPAQHRPAPLVALHEHRVGARLHVAHPHRADIALLSRVHQTRAIRRHIRRQRVKGLRRQRLSRAEQTPHARVERKRPQAHTFAPRDKGETRPVP